MTDPKDNVPNEDEPQVEGDATNAEQPEDLIEAEGPDVEVPTDAPAGGATDLSPRTRHSSPTPLAASPRTS
ncbi:hypothetical protein [Curtobacterium sp. 24E2]|nr:hypothetical protein JN350_05235 [Curtobacterium sp. 24E2]